jgi:hypothetical protein
MSDVIEIEADRLVLSAFTCKLLALLRADLALSGKIHLVACNEKCK